MTGPAAFQPDERAGRSVHIYRRLLRGTGGGELHTFALAEALSEAGYDVTCGCLDQLDPVDAARNSGLALEGVRFIQHADESQITFAGDLLIHVANADLALRTQARRMVALVFIPEPLHPIRDLGRVIRNQLLGRQGYDWVRSRLARYDEFWANSEFTRAALSNRWEVESRLLAPPLLQYPGSPPQPVTSRAPEVLLLGRISPEKQLLEVLGAFANSRLAETHTLRLVGDYGSPSSYGERVLSAASEIGAEIELGLPRERVLELLASARFLWHGMGIGIDPFRQPELVEQFGMVVLEAMAWGCIPVAATRGGPAELLPPSLQVSGFDELAEVTTELERLDPTALEHLQADLVARADKYRWRQFRATATSLVGDLIGPP